MSNTQLESLISGAHRAPGNAERNDARHPLETLEFFGLQSDMTVLEVLPALGWYTEILAPYLAEHGRLYEAHFSPNGIESYMPAVLEMFEERLVQQPEIFGKTIVRHVNPPNEIDIAPTAKIDLALVFRNVHNWLWAGQVNEYFTAIYKTLKPGGILGIEQHRAAPGTSLEQMQKSHYLTEAFVTEVAIEAGFVLEASSEINANAKDTKDHPKGAWSLPPFLQSGEEDKYRAIGESDRMTLRFRKPDND
ncbi:MAG: methyltransferase [Pseudomonadota bacterium]